MIERMDERTIERMSKRTSERTRERTDERQNERLNKLEIKWDGSCSAFPNSFSNVQIAIQRPTEAKDNGDLPSHAICPLPLCRAGPPLRPSLSDLEARHDKGPRNRGLLFLAPCPFPEAGLCLCESETNAMQC